MAKYIKLGPKSQTGSFYCPLLKLSVSPGQVVKVPSGVNVHESRIYKEAKQHLHIVDATEEEYNEYMETKGQQEEESKTASKKASKKKPKPVVEEDEDDEDEEEETDEEGNEDDEEDEDAEDEKLTKSELVEALLNSPLDDETKKGLRKMKVDKLLVLYNANVKK